MDIQDKKEVDTGVVLMFLPPRTVFCAVMEQFVSDLVAKALDQG